MKIETYQSRHGIVARYDGTDKAVTCDTEELAIIKLKQVYGDLEEPLTKSPWADQ